MEKIKMLTHDWLYQKYIIDGLSCQSIAEILNIKPGVVRNRLKKFNITMRSGSRTGKPNKKPRDLSIFIGRTTEMLEVIGFKDGSLNCKCKCGNIVDLEVRRITYDKQKSCGCKSITNGKGPTHVLWKGGKYTPSTYISKLKADAKRRSISFNVDIDDLDKLYEKQNGKCNLSGVDIYFSDGSASLDRIDSKRGYEKDNVQLLHRRINEMKWDYQQQEFVDWCRKVVENADVQQL